MNYPALLSAIAAAHEQARAGAVGAVNRHLVLRNWLIGAYLVEFEQRGEGRAKYGAGLLKRVAADLRAKSISGCAVRMLERMRAFYLTCPQLRETISSPVLTFSDNPLPADRLSISSSPMTKSVKPVSRANPRPLSANLLLRLSWTHLIELLAIDDPWKRAFYDQGRIRHRRPRPPALCLPLSRGHAQARGVGTPHRNRPRRLGATDKKTPRTLTCPPFTFPSLSPSPSLSLTPPP